MKNLIPHEYLFAKMTKTSKNCIIIVLDKEK